MAHTAFDTLAVTPQLKASGFDSDQAEAIAEAVRTGVTGGVVTKADLAEQRGEFRGDIAGLRSELSGIRTDLVWMKRIGGLIVALLAVPSLFARAVETNRHDFRDFRTTRNLMNILFKADGG